MTDILGQQLGQGRSFLVLDGLALGLLRRFLLRSIGGGLLLGIFGRLFLGCFGCRFLLGVFRGLFLGLLSGFLLGVFGRLLLGFLFRFLLGDVGQLLLFGLLRFGYLLGFRLLLGRLSLLGLLSDLFGLSSFSGFLLFRRLGRRYLLLFGLLLLQLFGLELRCSCLLLLASDLLVGLGGGLALGFELVQGGLHDRPGRRQFRGEGEADEQHAEHQDVQGHGPDGRPEVAFRGGAFALLLHQGASVISPTLATPAFCRPPITAITAP
ncbi:hypothetical protein D3C84_560700 [compost metagenome]